MMAYRLYLLLVLSYFLRIPERLPALGLIRFDLLLVLLIAALIVVRKKPKDQRLEPNPVERYLRILMIYIVVSLPFVAWPGSVLLQNSQVFIKAVVFFYFTVALIDTEQKLKTLVAVFLGVQIFRVLEPLYLHVTEGYWGAIASMADWQYMYRLSGSPYDVINPNGLAFVIVTVIALFHFIGLRRRGWVLLCYLMVLPALLYALILTGSRSGVVALFIIMFFIFIKSRRKAVFVTLCAVGAVMSLAVMDDNQRDRYLSIFSSHTKNAETAEGRMSGLRDDFGVAMNRPLFGHGLGTSLEANWNARGGTHTSHSLYFELLQELGIIGTVIFLLFMKGIIVNFIGTAKLVRAEGDDGGFLASLIDGMQAWLGMNLIFSLASYGLSSYEWYFFGGISVVVARMAYQARGGKVGAPNDFHMAHLPRKQGGLAV